MTVTAASTRNQYVGNGVAVNFAYGFKILQASDLRVTVNGVVVSNYSVSGVRSETGGTVTFTVAPAAGASIMIRRAMAYVRATDYQFTGELPADTLNDDQDSPVMMIQQLNDQVARAIVAPDSDAAPQLTLPEAALRANRVLAFDSSGNAIGLVGVDASSASALSIDLSSSNTASKGAGQVGFNASLAYTGGTVGRRLIDIANLTGVSVAGALFDNVTDDRAALQSAIDAVAAAGGGVLCLPRGTAKCSGHLTVPLNVSIRGHGKLASGIMFTHTGDGVRTAQGINASTPTRQFLSDFFISNTNAAANTGGGLVDIGSTELDVFNLYIDNFRYQVIFDQTEVSSVKRCDFQIRSGQVGVWLVNGADHTPGVTFTAAPALGATSGTLTAAWSGTTGTYNLNFVQTAGGASVSRPALLTNGSAAVTWSGALNAACNAATVAAQINYTNRIVVSESNFNGSVGALENVRDDGGTSHSFNDNNFNAGSHALRASGVYGLVFIGNGSEVHSSMSLRLAATTAAGAYVGPCQGFSVLSNLFIDTTANHIQIDDAQHGQIVGNTFGQATAASINFNNGASNPSTGVRIANNKRVIVGAGKQSALMVDGFFPTPYRNNQILLVAQSYVPLALGATGSQTVTPATMEGINVGNSLVCQNADGTAFEVVQVTGITSTTFTATFASTKTANWLVMGTREKSQILQRETIAYSASMTPNMFNGDWQTITATNGTAFTINAPTNAADGMELTITLKNASGGALGAATWNAIYKMSAWTNPANGQNRSITFRYDGTNWAQVSQTGVDVPN